MARKFTLLLILCLWMAAGCNDNKRQISDNKNLDRSPTVTNSNTFDSTYVKMFQKYISTYNEEITLDTTFAFKEDTIVVKYRYYCLFDNQIELPPKYIWGQGVDEFRTHNFATDIIVKKNNKEIYRKTIDKRDFEDQLYDALLAFGVMKRPIFKGIDAEDSLLFNFSISIPLTDVGKGVPLKVPLEA